MNEQQISLSLIKWRPDNIDKTFINLVFVSECGNVEWRWTEENFQAMLRELEAKGSVQVSTAMREMHFDMDYDD